MDDGSRCSCWWVLVSLLLQVVSTPARLGAAQSRPWQQTEDSAQESSTGSKTSRRHVRRYAATAVVSCQGRLLLSDCDPAALICDTQMLAAAQPSAHTADTFGLYGTNPRPLTSLVGFQFGSQSRKSEASSLTRYMPKVSAV
jgi:hypothetical protein